MTDVYRIGVSMALTNNVSQILGVIARDFMGVRGEVSKTEAAMSRLRGVMLGVGSVLAGGAILSGMGKLVEHGTKLVHQQALMAEQGMTVREQAEATAAAYKTASDVMGTNVSRNAALVRELRGVLGNTGDALTALPQFAKAGTLLESLKGGKAGENSLQVLAKALELRGDLINAQTGKIDPATLRAGLDQAFRTMSASGGLISANDLMGVMKQAGPMARMMTAQQFYDTAFSAIMEMGGQRAGTALSAVGRAIYGGIMPKRNAMEFERLHLLDPNAVEHLGAGATRINPAGFRGLDELNKKGLLAYVQDVIKPAMDRVGIHSQADEQKELYRLFPTETARRMIGLFLQQAETVRRDIGLRAGAQGVDQAYDTGLKEDPTIKMKAFKEAWDNLMTSLGAPLVTPATNALVWLAKEVNQATLFFSQHPDGVRIVGEFTAALGGLLVLGGSIQVMTYALGPFVTGLRAVVGLTNVAATGQALGTMATGLRAVTGVGGLAALGGSLAVIATGLGLIAAAAAAFPALTGAGIGGGNAGTFRGGRNTGHVYDGTEDTQKSGTISQWLDRKLQDWGIEGRQQTSGAQNSESAHAPAGPTHGDVYLNDKKVGYWKANSGAGTQGGTTAFDPKRTLQPGAVPFGSGN
jgi:hypothetical protein